MKIWLDDTREPIPGYKWVKSVNDAKELILDCESKDIPITEIELDYDLGDYELYGGNGMNLLEWLHERGAYYPCDVHSTHIYGAPAMRKFIKEKWG